MAMKLLLDKNAFNCFCSSDELEASKQKAKEDKKPYRYDNKCLNMSDEEVLTTEDKPFSVRIKKPKNDIEFDDISKGHFKTKPFDVDSFTILRQDKTPTYNFACAVDDMLYDISTIVRGEDHLSNTPKQILIRDCLKYTKEIKYLHLPMILNQETGKKMSKRDDGASVKQLVDMGFLPSAIANYLLLLGYNPEVEIFTIEDAVKWYDINKISKSPAKFDIKKLQQINRVYIEKLDEMRLSKIIGYADKDIGLLAKVFLEESNTTNELKEKIDAVLNKKDAPQDMEDEFNSIKECIKNMQPIDDFNEFKKELQEKTQLKGAKLMKPLRQILTNKSKGPNLSEIYPLIKNYLLKITQ
jgi:glutamyl-tRNA synthetase